MNVSSEPRNEGRVSLSLGEDTFEMPWVTAVLIAHLLMVSAHDSAHHVGSDGETWKAATIAAQRSALAARGGRKWPQ